ncbi:MAG: hypothetical protein DHS20C01_09580 [marine bacterium B5-7]|nr:MAG: hypothetical protein DHS20C01_09580 [marine bacterium B5-7]
MKASSHTTRQGVGRLADDLLSCCDQIAAAISLPRVETVLLPRTGSVDNGKSRKFGLVVLEDHSTGLFFTRLSQNRTETNDSTLAHIEVDRFDLTLLPRDVLELAAWYRSDNLERRAMGLGAISAITQALFRQSDYRPPDAINPIANLEPEPGDHFGMVGFFPGLVDKLRNAGVRLTVLELDERFVQSDKDFEVTLDPRRLSTCNKVLCTASTLINDTVDDILACAGDAHVTLIGPSAGCMPEPLFKRGVIVIGGSRIVDFKGLEICLQTGVDWSACVEKYCLTPSTYPGTALLTEQAMIRSAQPR